MTEPETEEAVIAAIRLYNGDQPPRAGEFRAAGRLATLRHAPYPLAPHVRHVAALLPAGSGWARAANAPHARPLRAHLRDAHGLTLRGMSARRVPGLPGAVLLGFEETAGCDRDRIEAAWAADAAAAGGDLPDRPGTPGDGPSAAARTLLHAASRVDGARLALLAPLRAELEALGLDAERDRLAAAVRDLEALAAEFRARAAALKSAPDPGTIG